MTTKLLLEKIHSLDSEKQALLWEFVEFLDSKNRSSKKSKSPKREIRKDPFVGMWKDRKDMMDSVAYQKEIRKKYSKRKVA